VVATELTLGVVEPARPVRWGRLRELRRSPSALIAACVMVLLIIVAIAGPLFATTVGNHQNLDLRFLPPFSTKHGFWYILGADALGRPMLAQLILGARTTFIIAAVTVVCGAVLGLAIGLTSGYIGGWFDAIVMRLSDILMTIPSLLLALVVLYVLSPSVFNLILVLVITRLPVYMRVARAQTLSVRERVFIEAARAIGARASRIIIHEIRPMVVPTILTVAMLEVAAVILAAAGLSFLGVGLQRPNVDWGIMISDGRDYLTVAWWNTVFPGIMVILTAMAANILSNWLRQVGEPGQRSAKIRISAEPAPGSSVTSAAGGLAVPAGAAPGLEGTS
jgi:peptide/nickel transport system permease protein